MNKKQIKQLLFRYHNGICTDREKVLIEEVYERLQEDVEVDLSQAELDRIGEEIFVRFQENADVVSIDKHKKRRYLWFAGAAASIALFLIIGLRYFDTTERHRTVIQPGMDKAVLTLAGGETIDLTNIPLGGSIRTDHAVVSRTESGEIVHEAFGAGGETVYHELNVPRGGKFRVVLPDGTRVWINAASTLKYASNFDEQRNVELTGEAYFEVQPNEHAPFHIRSDRANITVLGTAFGLRSYPEDDRLTTYVTHGSVKVFSQFESKVLKAHDLAVVNHKGEITVTVPESTNALAWKDDIFQFDGTSIEEIAGQIQRWYDVEVEIDPSAKGIKFYGVIPRKESANQLFEILEATNTIKVRFRDRNIIVSKR